MDEKGKNNGAKDEQKEEEKRRKCEERQKEEEEEQVVEQQQRQTEEHATQPSSTSSSAPPKGDVEAGGSNTSTLPNFYSKFVTSFESALQNLVTEEQRPLPRQKLVSLDLEGVAAFIREENPPIVFMVGAGISTSAGIPDFRTPGTGFYDNLQQFDLPYAQAIFEIDFFKRTPEPFFVLAKELFHENVKPTPAHYFIRLVEQKGLLRRCFTQNIDALEYEVGLSDDKIVSAHGSHRTSTCLGCKKKYDHKWIMAHLKNTESKIPRCESCKKGVVKPDIVFFGESLPTRFFSCSLVDLPKCELLIIMGTSLVVHPFASLVENVPEDTPRLLINLQTAGKGSLHHGEPGNKRDVFWEGECDAGVMRLATLLGWEQELKALIRQNEPKTDTDIR